MNIRIYSHQKNDTNMIRTNIRTGKYSNIFEYPNIRHTLTWNQPGSQVHTFSDYGGRDAEGVPWETLGIRALPWAPHVSDTTSLPSRKSWLNFGGNIEIFFVFFYVECERLPVGYEHFCGLLPSFKCY